MINIPYHLVVPPIVTGVLLGLVILNRKRLLQKKYWRIFWLNMMLSLIIYTVNVGRAAYVNLSLQYEKKQYDYNNDGYYDGSGEEASAEYSDLLKRQSNDVGRNFSPFVSIILVLIIALPCLAIGLIIERIYFK